MLPATLAITNNEYVAVKQTKNNDAVVYRNSNYLSSWKYQMTSKHCLALQIKITNVWKRQQYQYSCFPFLLLGWYIWDLAGQEERTQDLKGKRKDSRKQHTLSLPIPSNI